MFKNALGADSEKVKFSNDHFGGVEKVALMDAVAFETAPFFFKPLNRYCEHDDSRGIQGANYTHGVKMFLDWAIVYENVGLTVMVVNVFAKHVFLP